MSRKSDLRDTRFCPFCGLERLQRDSYKSFKEHKFEFICLSCGRGFRIISSTRVQDANRMMAHERKLRVPNKTNPADDLAHFRAVCKKKFKEFKQRTDKEFRREIGERMRDWLESEEAKAIRGHRPSGDAKREAPMTETFSTEGVS